MGLCDLISYYFETLAKVLLLLICLSFITQAIAKSLDGLSVESGSHLQKVLRLNTCTSRSSAIQMLEALLPVFRSRMGALLFLISALLSRGLVYYSII